MSSPEHAPSPSATAESNANNDLDSFAQLKRRDILEACQRREIASLRALAEARGGFLNDDLRRKACPSSFRVQHPNIPKLPIKVPPFPIFLLLSPFCLWSFFSAGFGIDQIGLIDPRQGLSC